LLILASASPRRRQLLEEAGVEFLILPVDVDETPPPALEPEEVATALAERKARVAAALTHHRPVLGADTIVTLEGEILGKPGSPGDVRATLFRLSGRTHEVFTGLCLLPEAPGEPLVRVVRTEVTFRELGGEEVHRYASSAEPRDKAGCYAIQGEGAKFVERIEGSRSNVIGLPVSTVREMLA
jgi:septum formation protein